MDRALYLAQLNIGRFRYPTDDPRMADFMNNLDLVNALAERSEGFVWRLKDGSGNTTGWKYTVAVDDSTELYSSAGKLLSIADRAGSTITLTYSDASTPSSVAPAPGYLILVLVEAIGEIEIPGNQHIDDNPQQHIFLERGRRSHPRHFPHEHRWLQSLFLEERLA